MHILVILVAEDLHRRQTGRRWARGNESALRCFSGWSPSGGPTRGTPCGWALPADGSKRPQYYMVVSQLLPGMGPGSGNSVMTC